jgi:polyhydroxybutyrate depolymerase
VATAASYERAMLFFKRTIVIALSTLQLLAMGCSKSDETVTDAGGQESDDAGSDASDGGIVATRPYTLKIPTSYDAAKPTPLLVLLHGYSASGYLEDAYFGFSGTAEAKGFLYAYADGTKDSQNKQFWNATDGCCNFDKSTVDDVAYIGAIMDDVSARYNVDKKRIYVVGHSNGGFTAHRLACDLAPRVAAIVSLAGETWLDATKCNPSEPVSVLDVHGDADDTILYDGGSTSSGAYPSEQQTLATWAGKDHCTGALAATGETLDIDTKLAGAETVVEKYAGCPAGIDVARWTIQGGGHLPSLASSWGPLVFGFLSDHPKP